MDAWFTGSIRKPSKLVSDEDVNSFWGCCFFFVFFGRGGLPTKHPQILMVLQYKH